MSFLMSKRFCKEQSPVPDEYGRNICLAYFSKRKLIICPYNVSDIKVEKPEDKNYEFNISNEREGICEHFRIKRKVKNNLIKRVLR